MTKEKILETIQLYRSYFESKSLGKIDFPHFVETVGFGDSLSILEHCHGGLEKMEQMVADGSQEKIEKVFCWLGFIQGCLWSQGIYSLDQLKTHNG